MKILRERNQELPKINRSSHKCFIGKKIYFFAKSLIFRNINIAIRKLLECFGLYIDKISPISMPFCNLILLVAIIREKTR